MAELIHYLAGLPLTWLFLTLLLFQLANVVHQRLNYHPLSNPTAWSIALLIPCLLATGTPYSTYFLGGQWIHGLLGPATVALAVPLYNNLPKLRAAWSPLLLTLLFGSLLGVLSGVGLGWLLGLPPTMLLSLAPRSVTTPIAMSVAEKIGGSASLAAIFVIVTGLLGNMFAKPLLARFRLDQPVILGYASGLAAHGLGTARAFSVSNTAGAFGALAMGLNGAFTAIWVPLLMHVLG